jgi:hypothetical protein
LGANQIATHPVLISVPIDRDQQTKRQIRQSGDLYEGILSNYSSILASERVSKKLVIAL